MGVESFIKEHPIETAAIAGGGVLVFILILSRGSSGGANSSSDLGTYYNAQLQSQNLSNANAVVQAQANAQNNQTNAAAQVQNDTLEAELAATALQYDSTNKTAAINADVENNYITQAASVSNTQTRAAQDVNDTYINASEDVANTQTAAMTTVYGDQFDYLKQVNNNQSKIAVAALPGATFQLSKGNNASQLTAASLIEALMGQTGPSIASAQGATQTEIGNQNTSSLSSILNSISGVVSSGGKTATGIFQGLFA